MTRTPEEEPATVESAGPRRPVVEGRTMLELLAPRECWELLAGQPLGRLAFLLDDEPCILPVNYAVFDGTVVFRTAGGSKLAAVATYPSVAFEVDGHDADRRTGWSVLLVGRPQEVRDPATIRALEALGLEPWPVGAKLHWVRLTPHRVTGRRLLPRTA